MVWKQTTKTVRQRLLKQITETNHLCQRGNPVNVAVKNQSILDHDVLLNFVRMDILYKNLMDV